VHHGILSVRALGGRVLAVSKGSGRVLALTTAEEETP
jgi:hypothetical protein